MELKVYVDDELMLRFKRAIKKKEGKLRGFLPKAIAEAISLYIEEVEGSRGSGSGES